ncbi:fibronectin type III domain-containing protein [Yinghuangia soli]|uniref:Fibronectin type III domain-containing protein n=1 Tax=Yinghuangia soli TaxID=2908204 RepID=A0AA41PYQ6_9ACTN|nr:putative Ig domain-containing protein [Yinghuangia soli]MCF2527616.1 fibronectin type III domain-containing protein [Yinghuangia soli]
MPHRARREVRSGARPGARVLVRAAALAAAAHLALLGTATGTAPASAARTDHGANPQTAGGSPAGQAGALSPAGLAGPAAPAERPARVPAVVTTQQQVEVTQLGTTTVQVPQDATAVSVTLYGAADTAANRPGSIATGSAEIGSGTPIRQGRNLLVVLDPVSTMLAASPLEPWLSAAGGSTPGTFPADPRVFPVASTQPAANPGPARALLVFTVPAGDIGQLPAGVDFGPVTAPGSALRNVTFTSSGTAPLTLTSITATPPFAVENTGTSCPAGTAIPAGRPCSVAVQVAVGGRGPVTGTLTFTGNMPGGSRTVALTAAGITIPRPPTGLSATAGDAHNVLSWMPPADDGGSPLTEYQIFRSGGEQAGTAVIGTVSAATLVYTDTGLTQGTAYTYTVRAVNQNGASEMTAPVTASPAAALAVATTVLAPATAGQQYSAKLQAVGGTPPYRWAADGPLPGGMTLDPLTGDLTGIPGDPGQNAFTVRVADSSVPAREAEQTLTFAVQPPAGSSPTPTANTTGQAARTPQTAGDGDGGTGFATWAWALLGGAGLVGAVIAVRRLRARS